MVSPLHPTAFSTPRYSVLGPHPHPPQHTHIGGENEPYLWVNGMGWQPGKGDHYPSSHPCALIWGLGHRTKVKLPRLLAGFGELGQVTASAGPDLVYSFLWVSVTASVEWALCLCTS